MADTIPHFDVASHKSAAEAVWGGWEHGGGRTREGWREEKAKAGRKKVEEAGKERGSGGA